MGWVVEKWNEEVEKVNTTSRVAKLTMEEQARNRLDPIWDDVDREAVVEMATELAWEWYVRGKST